jgi:protein-disulfide isomerase
MTRERRVWLLVGAAALAAVIVVVAIVVSQGGSDDGSSKPAAAPRGLFEGIPQKGVSLGDPNASATLIEFADLQCPFCRDYAVDTLPGVVDRYVRPGRLRLELRLLAFLGPDSEKGRQVAHAAAVQNRLWNFTDLFYENQGPENSGYVTDDFLRRLERETPGLDMKRLATDLGSPPAQALSREAERLADRLRVGGTPSFYLVKDGGQPQAIDIGNLGEALGGG